MSEADPIWGQLPNYIGGSAGGGSLDVDSDRCGGRFSVSSSALMSLGKLSRQDKAKLTTLIVDSNRLGEPLLVTTFTLEALKAARPLTVAERMNRFLLYFIERDFGPSSMITWLGSHLQTEETIRSKEQALAWIEAQEDGELGAFREFLVEAGLLRHAANGVFISARGFERMDELRRGGAPTRNVFVAMWFGGEMAEIYDNGIMPAIVDTGFTPVRIDRKEHVNKIDDEIVAEIKRAHFVVADFTTGSVDTENGEVLIPRGGVYYEAGLAQGRDIPVIWSVREDQIYHVHFDTRQFNHITWMDAGELRQKLTNRIRAIFADAR